MIVSPEAISTETLRNLVLEFIGREGTDYGVHEVDMDTKVQQVMHQLEQGDVMITYCDETESTNLITRHQAKELLDGNS